MVLEGKIPLRTRDVVQLCVKTWASVTSRLIDLEAQVVLLGILSGD